jgi:hypothetical protein
VAKEWRSEYVARLVSKLRGKPLDALLSKVATMMKEFLKIPYCEKFLYRNKDNGDIHIDPLGLSYAKYRGNNFTLDTIEVEARQSVERLTGEMQEMYQWKV